MSDVSSGIFALLGVAVGGIVSRLIQASGFKEADRVRFHEQRLQIYSKFIGLANSLVAYIHSGAFAPHAEQTEFLTCYETVRLIAGPSVRTKAQEVETLTVEIIKKGALSEGDIDGYSRVTVDLIGLMRSELGTNLDR